ncbi:ADP-ribosyltransferase domain-containing protein [Ihubacter massiliensis]|uniref:NAD(+)--protein-arginine ADP-ribosyltransferase n=1 Tax=Hominibacterium faecale TaxID=2839743 RepID=A0A9J6QQS2_9FIRM|nr:MULTISPECIES: ADP-ribosyltransferase domain-containing protein [Eubacteriales Family XIII. Incertae Sedis]MCI7300822.1 ADP-ribosyltransferase domain-containing protein [Clostridia bacterium]MCO7121235.1 ADP-ribosyltransferase domain-containing protein [Ihubacter massiliensis]MCU7378221.1 ADP-ribosyltransferase domain-containing protein [Hominibacterium faecale]MDY3012728.1 ADP-ribosyltransferase domain-containing protein [Clostridiales Family XIII bacterium]
MTLTLLKQTEVFYGTEKRKVSLVSGDLSALTAEDQVDYLGVSAFPNDYSPTGGSLIQALFKKGISVADLAKDKLADYRTDFPCWVSKDVSGAAFRRIAVYEPAGVASAYDMVSTLFSAVQKAQGSDKTPICVALPLVCTGCAGADEMEVMDMLFYAAYHWCGVAFPFSEIKITLYHNKASVDSLKARFDQLSAAYGDLEHLDLPDSYSYYAAQAASTIGKKELPPGLTYREAFAICVYSSNYFRTINGTLREKEKYHDVYKKMLPLIEAIDTGLMNMAVFAGKVYRGEKTMTPEREKENEKGNKVVNAAYTSTSYSPGGFYYGAPYRFQFQSLFGVVIEKLSIYPNEQEVLFADRMQYLVKDVTKESNYRLYTADEVEQALRR